MTNVLENIMTKSTAGVNPATDPLNILPRLVTALEWLDCGDTDGARQVVDDLAFELHQRVCAT